MNELKKIQELAWEEIHTPGWWYRKHYNLPPTDYRYLEATKEQILVDYYCHMLTERHQQLTSDGVKDITLETLLAEESFDEELAKIKHEEEEKEILIDFKA